MSLPPPVPEDQLAFLQKVQRILEEGQFVASYKFALLHALADLAVLRGRDTGDELPLSTEAIAEQFIGLYWCQTRPFSGRSRSAVLRQNTGRQAAILSAVESFQQRYGSSLAEARRSEPSWRSLVQRVRTVVREQPLWKLQVIGRVPIEFLYRNDGNTDRIVLQPGVAFCLRRFHGLIVELARSNWVRYLRTLNSDLLGNAMELEEFLFGAERTNLQACRQILLEAQAECCFYCRGRLGSTAEVDHFIPWALYSADIGHNFVLACRACNGDKQERLAAYPHLERWSMRNEEMGRALTSKFREAGLPADLPAIRRIAHWAYARLEMSGGLCWQADLPKKERMVNLPREWRRFFAEVDA